MSIEPTPPAADTKDWTWVLERPCPDCGYRADTPHDDVPGLVADSVNRWQTVLTREDVRSRPQESVWSPLEYACHVRDVYRIFGDRLALMLVADDPSFANWDQDLAAIEGRYWEGDSAVVSDEIRDAGTAIGDRFAAVRPDQWQRTGRRSNGSVFTVETLGWYFLHDVLHHLHDVDG